MALNSLCIPVKALLKSQRQDMFCLMDAHYENMHFDTFSADLDEKDKVLLLMDVSDVIRGFTTLKQSVLHIKGEAVQLIFSGDTIIDKDYWGDVALHKAWIRTVHEMVDPSHNKAYWVLISKGYKTYRFLPVYFKDFYPNYKSEMPAYEKEILDLYCGERYPDHYRPHEGIVHFEGDKDYLKPGIADISEKLLKDPHIQFFIENNPGYAKGDELVCICDVSRSNIRRRGLTYLEGME